MNINNRYIIYEDKCLGKGTFSKVYYGTTIDKSIEVAIKKIDITKYRKNKKILKSIENEINIMNIIKKKPHPNIVNCYDVLKIGYILYIILEYCECGDLGTLLTKPIKEVYAQYYFTQIVSGLKYLHDNDIIHRDIKPKNILLTNKRKHLKIADFGFAKYNYNNKPLYTICGSPLYMSPEIINGLQYNNQTDLWSLGMILYEMLYGFHPYNHCKTTDQLLTDIKINSIQIPPQNTINSEVSKECTELLKLLLQKNTSKRITWSKLFNNNWVKSYKYEFSSDIKDTTPESEESIIFELDVPGNDNSYCLVTKKKSKSAL